MADGVFIAKSIKNIVKHKLAFGEKDSKFSEVFVSYVSDIALEVEAINSKKMQNDIQSINEHIDRISRALLGIVDARLALGKKSQDMQN
ncbi:hypothetical protein NSIN_30238 [Nitrosotalea sinensis]|uniref:Uncharacterized protein n=1 Tax=Nitrosotalea sinensis TaxID=1499975 RepID=A0A2H1EHS8_9ARCH|nr:hypothetical protein NSIN_30238 [Candidatus Nitrosotalea sinensis]